MLISPASIGRRIARSIGAVGVLLLLALPLGGFAADQGPVAIRLTAADAVDGFINVPDSHGGPVTVIGNGQFPVRVFYNSWWIHAFVNTGRSITLEEQHATGQKITMTNVPAVYFQNGDGISLPDRKPLGAAPLPPPPPAQPAGQPQGGLPSIIRAPAIPKPAHPGEVVAIVLRNDTTAEIPKRVVTFGQAFVQGDLPKSATLAAKAGADPVPVQVDVKTRYPDGSVKYGIVSLQSPALAGSASQSVMLSAGPAEASASPISPKTILAKGYDLTLRRDFPTGSGLPPLATEAAKVLSAAVSDGSITTWLSGPLATEYRVSQKALPNLLITFDIRATTDGEVTTDVIVANDFAYLFPETAVYSATIAQTGMTAWKSPVITHRKLQVWHKLVSNRADPLPSVLLDIDYIEKSGAIPNYELSSGVYRATLDDMREKMAKADNGPLGNSLVTMYMGMTGGRDDIGPTTSWAANYLASQDPAARMIMLAQADVAGAVPWHVREVDGRMVTAATHPTLWLDYRCKKADCLPGGYSKAVEATGWGPEQAHEPDLAFIPYVVTGSHYYLDQLQSEANWLVLAQDPDYRGDEKGLIYPASQVRGAAWNLRDIGNAAWASPDGDPLKAYFQTVQKNNIDGLSDMHLVQHVAKAAGPLQGFILDVGSPASLSPWQQNFYALTMVQAALRNVESAKPLVRWMENFNVGLFTHASSGFNPLHGPAYYLLLGQPKGEITVNTWAGLEAATYGDKPAPTKLEGTPESNFDYAAIARAGTASFFSFTRNPKALQAFAFIAANSELMLRNFPKGNAFNINPRLPDGHLLQNDEIQYASPTGGRIVATDAHSMLIGGAAHVSLQGAKGVSILVGGSGPATLIGAAGANYFFAGTGDVSMSGASGQNDYAVGEGKAQIDLAVTDEAVDRIDGFRSGKDHIHLIGLTGELAKVLASARKAADGGTVLTIGPAHTVELIGMAPQDVTPACFN